MKYARASLRHVRLANRLKFSDKRTEYSRGTMEPKISFQIWSISSCATLKNHQRTVICSFLFSCSWNKNSEFSFWCTTASTKKIENLDDGGKRSPVNRRLATMINCSSCTTILFAKKDTKLDIIINLILLAIFQRN